MSLTSLNRVPDPHTSPPRGEAPIFAAADEHDQATAATLRNGLARATIYAEPDPQINTEIKKIVATTNQKFHHDLQRQLDERKELEGLLRQLHLFPRHPRYFCQSEKTGHDTPSSSSPATDVAVVNGGIPQRVQDATSPADNHPSKAAPDGVLHFHNASAVPALGPQSREDNASDIHDTPRERTETGHMQKEFLVSLAC